MCVQCGEQDSEPNMNIMICMLKDLHSKRERMVIYKVQSVWTVGNKIPDFGERSIFGPGLTPLKSMTNNL